LAAPIVAKDEFIKKFARNIPALFDHDLVRFGLRLVTTKEFLGARNSRFWPTD